MKTDELLIVGAALAAAWMIYSKNAKAGTGTGSTTKQRTGAVSSPQTSEIFDQWGASFDNGWRYFSDGTTIDPDGRYYRGGQLIWQPENTGGATGSWA